MRAFMRWPIIVAANPDVVIPLVLVVAVNPHVSTLGRWTGVLINRSRWPNADHNLRHGGHRAKGESEQNCQCNLLHHE
jgi:hypothetical protein